MSRDITSGLQEELYKSQSTICLLTLIKISHADLGADLLYVNNNEDITSNGDIYLKSSFEFTPPEDVDGKISNAKIVLDAVDRDVIFAVRSISSPATLTISMVEASDPDTIEVGPWDFELRGVTFNALRVTGDLIYQTYTRDNVSIIKYTNNLFPGNYVFTAV